ncbi:MAG: haloacid dehalogenase-like hydrolase, partial [Natronospirillum sp.]
MALAIFDLDNTLLAGDSDHAWGSYLLQRNKIQATDYQLAKDYFFAQYQRGKLDIHEYVTFVVGHLNSILPAELDTLRREF